MQYVASLPFRGDAGKAFGLAASALTAIGFRITEQSAGSMQFEGPGMNSTRQSPLVGASRIRISGGRGQIAVEADLGGVLRMSRFVTIFPVGLTLFVGAVLSVVFGQVFGPGAWMAIVAVVIGGNAVLWLLLGPLLARGIRARTNRSLDALLANMVSVGESG